MVIAVNKQGGVFMQNSGAGPQSMRYTIDEVLTGMLSSINLDYFTDDHQKLGEIFKDLSKNHPMLARYAAISGEGDFSAVLRDALQKMVDRKLLQHETGKYFLTAENRAQCVRIKRTLFNAADVQQVEAAAKDFDALLRA
jgi:hypothetical protein